LGVSPHEGPGGIDEEEEENGEEKKEDKTVSDIEMAEELDTPPTEASEATELLDLTVESDPEELRDARKGGVAKPKATATPSATKPKRAKKDKEASASVVPAASPAGSPQKTAPAEPVDPVVRARIASYQQKIDELTQLCGRLTHSTAADDAVLLEIYGVALDLDLDPASDSLRVEILDAWRALSQKKTEGTVELPVTLKHFVARSIQSRSDSLSALVKRLSTELTDADATASAASLLALEMEIKMLAQRTPYGAKPSKANLYEDATPAALWCWEVNNIELHFTDGAQKTIKRLRKQRKRTGAQLKSLSRAVQLLHQSPIDESKVATEEAKIGKFVSQVESELLKAREREKRDDEKSRKEQEKAQAVEEKKRLDHEKQLAKEEEKRRKEDEAAAEKLLAEKRRKTLVSYFRSIDTIAETAATTGSTAAAAVDVTLSDGGGGGSLTSTVSIGLLPRRVTGSEQVEIMASMDREVPYLVKDAASASASPSAPASRSGAALLQRQRALVTARVGHWCARRYRDEKLGLMKLLQFHENYRPAYFGTYSKRSVVFRRGRRPLAQAPALDYSVDSEEEWEEEEPGESLSDADSDADGEDEEDQLDYGDDWLAYEDEVEYVDGQEHGEDDDVVMDDDMDGDDEDATNATASRKRRRRRVAAENKKQKLTKLVPQLSGPFVCRDEDCGEHLGQYAGELLEETPTFESPLLKKAQAREDAAAAAAAAAQAKAEAAEAATAVTTVTPVVKKKKTKAAAAVAAAAASETTPVTPHKPPVKRRISPQLLSAAGDAHDDATTKPTTKKKADKPTTNGSTAVKSGITGWLKTPAAATTTAEERATITPATTAADAEATTASSSLKAPVEI
jgi:hypothetical protein